MSGLEFGVDTAIAGAAIATSLMVVAAPIAPFVAAGSLMYFGGKALYELYTGQTLFTKPQ